MKSAHCRFEWNELKHAYLHNLDFFDVSTNGLHCLFENV